MTITKRIPWIIGAAVAVIVAGVLIWLLVPWGEKAPVDRGKYTGYDVVVIAKDTPEAIRNELDAYQIEPIEYVKDRLLVGPGGLVPANRLDADPKIYLCEGTYNAGLGSFIKYTENHPLVITGDGKDKTIVTGGTSLYQNTATAIDLNATNHKKIKNAVIENLQISKFEYGIKVTYGENVQIRNVAVQENNFIGIVFERAYNCSLKNSEISLNGSPNSTDTGYGLSVLFDSKGNTTSNVEYKNNANQNAIDFVDRGEVETPKNNTISMKMVYDLKRKDIQIKDPLEEAQNAKPTAKSLRFECEKGQVDNTGAVVSTSTQKVKKYQGSGYVFLFNTKITMNVDIPVAGKYRVFVVGTSDDGNNKCDYFQVNGGTKYLTSYLGSTKGAWTMSQPGTEFWENNELHPVALTNGFEFNAGKNVIEITANWGYCAYDSVILEPIQ
ncbi:MAG: right-handed parallel beta-helix repeat-containing protein [Oscillospiraceae bacterium]|nr:right-handed parallel beta-helix repeat-containing protein [Oscillospiraceae bacterium]